MTADRTLADPGADARCTRPQDPTHEVTFRRLAATVRQGEIVMPGPWVCDVCHGMPHAETERLVDVRELVQARRERDALAATMRRAVAMVGTEEVETLKQAYRDGLREE